MRRWFGLILLAAGYLVLVLDVPGLEQTVLSLTRSHGVEASDLVGGVLIASGVVAIWHG
jgi:hypothetical protein